MDLLLHKKFFASVRRSVLLSVTVGDDEALVINHDTGNIHILENIVRVPASSVQDPEFTTNFSIATASMNDLIAMLSGNNHIDVHMAGSDEEYFQLCLIHKYVYPPSITRMIIDILKASNARS